MLVAVSITDTELCRRRVGDVGAGAVRGDRHPDGLVPTVMAGPVTVLVVVSITDTELSLKLVT